MTYCPRIIRSSFVGATLWLALVVPASAQVVVPATPSEAGAPRHPALPDTMDTARGMAMGLGARASATSTSAIAYNAAGMSISRLYHVETAIVYEPMHDRFATNSALMDSYSGPVNMAVSFRYLHGNGRYGHGGYDGRIALGLPLGDNFAIGVTGRYMSFWQEGQAEDENLPALAENITMDGSIRVSPLPGFHIAALGYNLIPVESSLVPIQVGGSISYTIDNTFTLAFDGLADLSTWHDAEGNILPEGLFGAAAELFTGEVPIRAGWSFDTGRDIHYVTAGAGWMNDELSIELGARQQVTGPTLDTQLLASFRYLVH